MDVISMRYLMLGRTETHKPLSIRKENIPTSTKRCGWNNGGHVEAQDVMSILKVG